MTNTANTDPTTASRNAAEAYFDAWRERDFDRLRTVLAPDVSFVGVMGTADGADACIAGLRGMAESIMADLVLHARVADGADVITWFDLVTKDGTTLPTLSLIHI